MTESLTLSELSRILPLSRSAIQALTRKGELPAERKGRRTYIKREAVEAFLQRCIEALRPKVQPAPTDVAIEVPVVNEVEDDVRGGQRYLTKVEIIARMVTTEARILDVSEHGMRMHHARALRIGSEGKVSFEIFGLQRIWVVRGKVVWSHLSTKGYISGIEIADQSAIMSDAITCLQRLGAIELDGESLKRKRESRMQKTLERNAMLHAPRAAELQAQQIRATMGALRSDPIAAQRWYSRARYALAEESVRNVLPLRGRERDEALAIWEALDRKVDIRTVCKIVAEA